jgi:riboflavin kinase/FMN adenylyltransferase
VKSVLSVDEATGRARARLLAIGNFDGVHRGHQALLGHLLSEAVALGLEPSLMTFDPHPAQVLGKRVIAPLTDLSRKRQLLSSVAPTLEVLVQPFDLTLAQMEPERFVRELLVDGYRVQRVVVGANFRFGKDRKGDLSTLMALGAELGFSAAAMPLVTDGGEVISSSRIRALVQAGEVVAAAGLLGRPHRLTGSVVQGRQLGRQLGFPTANLDAVPELLPALGVYACRVYASAPALRAWPAVCNIGMRPTVDGTALSVEVHLLAFSGDLYGRSLGVDLVQRLREEKRFAGIDALREQITRDVVEAQAVLSAG